MRGGLERVRAVSRPSEGLNLKYVVLGVVAAFLLAVVLSGIMGVVMYQGWLSEAYSPLVMNIASFASLFFGAVYTGRRASTSGWVHGGLTGLFYIVTVTVIGLLAFDQLAPLVVLLERAGLGLILGAVAGTVGINLRF